MVCRYVSDKMNQLKRFYLSKEEEIEQLLKELIIRGEVRHAEIRYQEFFDEHAIPKLQAFVDRVISAKISEARTNEYYALVEMYKSRDFREFVARDVNRAVSTVVDGIRENKYDTSSKESFDGYIQKTIPDLLEKYNRYGLVNRLLKTGTVAKNYIRYLTSELEQVAADNSVYRSRESWSVEKVA